VTETKDKVDVLIQDDCHITSELFITVGTEKPAGIAIIRELGYRKVCSKWVLNCSQSNTHQPRKTPVQYFFSTVRKTEIISVKNNHQ
jgi:hypothetical protein